MEVRRWNETIITGISKTKKIVFTLFVISFFVFSSTTIVGGDPDNSISVSPINQTVSPQQTFDVDIYCTPSEPIKAFELTVLFDESILRAVSVSEGNIFNDFETFFNSGTIDNINGKISEIYGLILGKGTTTEPGTFITISFDAKDVTDSSLIELVDVGITNETQYLSVTLTNGNVQVDTSTPSVVDYSPDQAHSGDSFRFYASATDNFDDSEDLTLKVDWSHGSLSGIVNMNYDGGTFFSKTVYLDPDSVDDLTYKYYCIDPLGNIYTTPLYNVPVSDNDPPTISSVSASPSSQEIGGNVYLSAEIEDNDALNNIYLELTYPNNNFQRRLITKHTGNTYYYSRNYYTAGTYTFKFSANDINGNSVISDLYSFSIKDITPPLISNVNIITSEPLDTNPKYGWFNITCEVTDNIELDSVNFCLTKPNNSFLNVSMNSLGSNIYYYRSNVDFSTFGNYEYFIWANDTTNNYVMSEISIFSMPPNWDINEDGTCSINDLIEVANSYLDIGPKGWIREDVDNNGIIELADLVTVSNHHGETWNS